MIEILLPVRFDLLQYLPIFHIIHKTCDPHQMSASKASGV